MKKFINTLALGLAVGCAADADTGTSSLVEGSKADGPALTCSASDAVGVGDCDQFLGFAWNGEQCSALSGCSCEGEDCAKLTFAAEACEASAASCREESCKDEDRDGDCDEDACVDTDLDGLCDPSESCEPVLPVINGECDLYLGVAWDGEACIGLSGCECKDGCDSLFDSTALCEATYAACG